MEVNNLGNPIVNNYVFRAPGGLVMVDSGYKNSFASCCKQMKRHDMDIKDIRFVFLTHAHDDHAGFLRALLEVNEQVKIIVHQNALVGLARGNNSPDGCCTSLFSLRFSRFMNSFFDHSFPPLTEADSNRLLVLSDETRAAAENALGGRIFETPGHTPDSVSLLLADGTLFCGDAAMNGFPTRHKIPLLAEDRDAFIASWKKIIALQPKTVFPGHGGAFAVDALSKNLPYTEKIKLRLLRKGSADS